MNLFVWVWEYTWDAYKKECFQFKVAFMKEPLDHLHTQRGIHKRMNMTIHATLVETNLCGNGLSGIEVCSSERRFVDL